ncbi:glycosyltransferase [Kitasatospora phosalacinea]|uniref:Glycosyl transferase n=1 Tax=Kitasatospora phosalacinea TaxID=2065 RepID=A0A9W6PBQ3_9ACTN|nr:glycosyltransferase [Kitasatospora phosalacinea]GLW52022.1 glycosyl transferase [Kitasatospora phosalacinea]
MAVQPTVSVVIPTYNRADLLGHTLDALAGQDLPAEQFEVLVVDDGSTDGTAEVVRAHRDRGRLRVRYFFQEDEGFRVAAARNVGIANAEGEVCVFVDSGVLLHSGGLRAHLDTHRATEGPAAVCGYVYCFNQDNEDAREIRAFVDPAEPSAAIEALRADGRWPDYREGFYARNEHRFHELPAPWFLYWTCNTSANTEQLRSVGMFDEAFRCWGGEDIDLGYRLHLDGARFVVNREAAALHYPHEKAYDERAVSAVDNYRYIAGKYATPITDLLTIVPTVDFLTVNDRITEQGLPRCADFLAAQRG